MRHQVLFSNSVGKMTNGFGLGKVINFEEKPCYGPTWLSLRLSGIMVAIPAIPFILWMEEIRLTS